jgi:chemotaxis protein histidine kinase CheA
MSQPAREGQVFAAPTPLRDRLGPRFGRIDPDAVAKAEAALRGLSSQFAEWLADEVSKLEVAREALRSQGANDATMNRLYTHAHDLKGLGATYEFPIITRIAASLCKLLGEPDERLKAPLGLIDAHVDTIRAAVRDNIRDSDNPMGRVLAEELERQTALAGR